MLLDSDGNVAGLAQTGADGGYSFENLPEGDYTVVASGYPPAAAGCGSPPAKRRPTTYSSAIRRRDPCRRHWTIDPA